MLENWLSGRSIEIIVLYFELDSIRDGGIELPQHVGREEKDSLKIFKRAVKGRH